MAAVARFAAAPYVRMQGEVDLSISLRNGPVLIRPSIKILLALCIAAALLCGAVGCDRGLEPLKAPEAAAPAPPLPAGTIVLNAGDASEVTAPFNLLKDTPAPGAQALSLPEGAGTKGGATFALAAPAEGTYYGWAQVRWDDSCGNSLALRAGDGPEFTVGQDHVFGPWHWVPAGKHELAAGEHKLTIAGREDGVALAQLLFTTDKAFRPTAAIGPAGALPGIRRFADDFYRSPGHGMEGWDMVVGQWDIAFSLDPNRIPNQYSLVGCSYEEETVALIRGPPWRGARLSFSARPAVVSTFGAVLDRRDGGKRQLHVAFHVTDDACRLEASGPGLRAEADVTGLVRPDQWHRIEIERWAWVLRVAVDGRVVLYRYGLPASGGRLGLFVAPGEVAFDDVNVEEIPWHADDGREFTIPWQPGEDARWVRNTSEDAELALVGKRGTISAAWPGMEVQELVLESVPGAAPCTLVEPKLARRATKGNIRLLRRAEWASARPERVTLRADTEGVRLRRVAVRCGAPVQDTFRIGPYHFTEKNIPDPSDYLDFTPEEYAQISASPDADKLLRRPKFMPVVGRGADSSPWVIVRGAWNLTDGALRGMGPGAELRHGQEIVSDLELRLRFRTTAPSSALDVELYGGVEPGSAVRISTPGAAPPEATATLLNVEAPEDGEWHELRVTARGASLSAALDGKQGSPVALTRGAGGRALLKIIAGAVEFDDVQFLIPRRAQEGCYYAFDRRETDWSREGAEWIDHGGISCALASSWVSLVAPRGEGMLWNKRPVGPNAMVCLNIEENSAWYGWHKNPSHVHFPYDNIRVALGTEADVDKGYRLEVNALGRAATVLYRDGKEVARVAQNASFPIRYVGGHAPYSPRNNRITLVKRGATIEAIVNARKVLTFTDPEPLDVSRVGLGGYATHVNFSHVEVRSLQPPSPAM